MRNYRLLFMILVVVLPLLQPGIARHASAGRFTSCAAVTQIPEAECDALVALYNSANGAGWHNHTNWLVTDTPGDWYGVTVTGGHVTQIALVANLLLSGSIPPQLGSLANLQNLDLSGNWITGGIPPELGSLANLQYLDLSSNQLSSIPPQLGGLANLLDLDLSSNQLSSIPPQLGSLANLLSLNLSSNLLLISSIPLQLGSLANLQQLDLSYNQLSGSIPPQLGSLTNLHRLDLYHNQFSSIPSQLGSLTNLSYLDLSFNQFSGSIPPQLDSLMNLQYLYMHDDQFSGSIPPELGSLTNLQTLVLSGNQLSGSIPPQLGSMANLQYLNLSGNQLTGSIPSELGSLANLDALYLNSNQLGGSIPLSFTALTQLGYFDASATWLCEPHDTTFQMWKVTVLKLYSSPGLCYSISGQVKRGANPLAGVTISDGIASAGAASDVTGAYTLNDLPPGSYTLMPSLPGYVFIPPWRSVTITLADLPAQDFHVATNFSYLPLVQRH